MALIFLPRLQAVPFWIVERSREIAEREKTGSNERRGSCGEAPLPKSVLVYFSSLQSRCERTLSTDQKGTACSLISSLNESLQLGVH